MARQSPNLGRVAGMADCLGAALCRWLPRFFSLLAQGWTDSTWANDACGLAVSSPSHLSQQSRGLFAHAPRQSSIRPIFISFILIIIIIAIIILLPTYVSVAHHLSSTSQLTLLTAASLQSVATLLRLLTQETNSPNAQCANRIW